MRQLLLLRHAKSSWDDPSLADFARPLAPRGEKAAPLMGKEMARRGWLPDFALVSAAARTRQTWELVAAQMPSACPVRFTEAIYEAAPQAILAEISQAPADAHCLLVVGHNPGLEMLSRLIAGAESARAALDRLDAKFPTAALARFEVETAWSGLSGNAALLTDFLRPRDLE